jgi:hypothetical protein
MGRIALLIAACTATVVFAAPAGAVNQGRVAEHSEATPKKEDLGVLVDTIRSNRKALVAASLGLTADEATKFWPLYDQYQKDLAPSGDRVVALIAEYTSSFGTLSNDKALELIKGYGEAEAERLKVRLSYIDKFAQILPGRTVARFYQIENKMDAVLRYDLAATIPVVDEKSTATAR